LGQKTNPIGIRLGIIRQWDANWFDEKNVAEKLQEDLMVRNYLKSRLKKAGVQKPGAAGTGSNVAPANAGAGGAPSPSRGAGGTRTMRLSASDLQSMRTFKLDPTNKAHVQQYLREMRSERSEAA
jgi:hypothetical protein